MAVLSLATAAPASAKGPAMTWSIEPSTPRPGQAVTITMRTWHWRVTDAAGEGPSADLSRPWNERNGGRIFEGAELKIYRSVVPPRDRRRRDISIRLKANPPSQYHARVTFPGPGDWIVGFAGGLGDCRTVVPVRRSGKASEAPSCPDVPSTTAPRAISHLARLRNSMIAMAIAGVGGLALLFEKHRRGRELLSTFYRAGSP